MSVFSGGLEGCLELSSYMSANLPVSKKSSKLSFKKKIFIIHLIVIKTGIEPMTIGLVGQRSTIQTTNNYFCDLLI